MKAVLGSSEGYRLRGEKVDFDGELEFYGNRF